MKKFLEKIETNRYIKLVSIVAVVLGSIITIVTFLSNVEDYLYKNVFISKNISDTVNKLSAGQSVNYFKQVLGSEIIKRNVSEEYAENIFHYKNAFIQVIINKSSDEVVFWSMTACDPLISIKRKTFPNSNELILNKSTISDIFGEKKGDFEYFVSGATANSFAYESIYQGNPSAYQTIIIGSNDICSQTFIDLNILGDFENNASNENIAEFRNKAKVNTYGETAPFYGEDIIKLLKSDNSQESSINFGVDRIRVRYFN